MIDEEKCWQAVLQRDKTQDGLFFYGVVTTKVFCRPGCSSRLPLRKNIRFYRTAAEAQADGFRACQRCSPVGGTADIKQNQFSEIRKYIFNNLEDRGRLKLETLSKHFHMSPFHLQRTFKMGVGVTPKQYAEDLRMQTFKEDLRNGSSVTKAVYDAGFGSSSRVYERVDTQLGMTPRQYRSGGKDVQISYATTETPLGLIMIGATDRGLCFLEFGQSKSELLESLKHEYPAAKLSPLRPPFSTQYLVWIKALTDYLGGQTSLGKLPLALAWHCFPDKGLELSPDHSERQREVLRGSGRSDWAAERCACSSRRMRGEQDSPGCTLPSSDPRRWRHGRLSLGLGPEARLTGYGAQKRCGPKG